MPPKFGTSGLRGLVTDLTPDLVAGYVRAFLRACPVGTGLWIGHDLRASSPGLAGIVAAAARAVGVDVTACGAVPTPALALAAGRAGAAAIMITGSHIPADRNGLKFYTPQGEITKDDELVILAMLETVLPETTTVGGLAQADANAPYVARYVSAWDAEALAGMRVGVWTHSAVGRDVTMTTLKALGAEVVEIGRVDHFVPVDTEAVDAGTRRQLAAWAAEHRLDALVSTDGDGDRPLLADADGRMIAGDVLGQITAAALGAEVIVTPVSSNTGAGAGGRFARVVRTRIGSPYVIAAMEAAATDGARVAGYEANGGFLLGFEASGSEGPISPLMTRDALLPVITALTEARDAGLAARVAQEPARFTAQGRLQEVETARTREMMQRFEDAPEALAAFLKTFGGTLAGTDRTDGLRMTLQDGRVVHLRPSGNAPELRFYVEADSAEVASETLGTGLAILAERLK